MYTPCIESIAKSIGMDCANPLVNGNSGRGVIIPWDGIQGVLVDENNPRKLLDVTLKEGAVVCALDNAMLTAPLEGSNTAGNNDGGFAQFVKVVAARILKRGADNSKDLVEPLVKNASGFLILVEKLDKVGDGSFEVVGLKAPAKCVDPSTVVRNEGENGGAITFQLQAAEPWFECTLCPTPLDGQTVWQAAKAKFDEFFASGAPA